MDRTGTTERSCTALGRCQSIQNALARLTSDVSAADAGPTALFCCCRSHRPFQQLSTALLCCCRSHRALLQHFRRRVSVATERSCNVPRCCLCGCQSHRTLLQHDRLLFLLLPETQNVPGVSTQHPFKAHILCQAENKRDSTYHPLCSSCSVPQIGA